MTFGYYRSEVIGALFSILVIWLLTGVLVFLAVKRVITQDYEIESTAMVITASCGVAFNIIMFIVLHTDRCFGGHHHHGHSHGGHAHDGDNDHDEEDHDQHHSHNHHHNHSHNSNNHSFTSNNQLKNCSGHHSTTAAKFSTAATSSANVSVNLDDSDRVDIVDPCSSSHHHHHGHGHSHDHEHNEKGKSEKNINLRAAAIHVIGDFIQSLGVLTASLIIFFKVIYEFNIWFHPEFV